MQQRESGFDEVLAEKHARRCEKPKRLIVTSAQNNTDPHEGFLASLKVAARHFKCEIAIVPNHYKNITLMTKDKKQWVDEVTPYLVKSDINFNGLLVKSDVRINATTRWPLANKQAHGGSHWLVFGHPQVAMEPVASTGGTIPKMLFTTGSCTVPNYSQSNDGVIALFDHVTSALIIERDGDKCWVRQLIADSDGSFYDLNLRFTPDGVEKCDQILSIVCGDEHVKFNSVEKVTYGKSGIVDTLKPKFIIRHDILDAHSISHHHLRDPLLMFKKHHNGDNDAKKELDQCVDFINRTTPKYSTSLIVGSNHHDHLYKYLSRTNPNDDHQNAIFIAEMQLKMREAALRGDNYDPFYLYVSPRLSCKHTFLDRNKPYILGDVDVSQHGDCGINGSKGSAKQFANTTLKMTIGHSHSARICKGVFQVGSSTGRLDYESGLSNHTNTHCVQYANFKRALITIIDGRWRL
jgi:hypothetical protein